MTQNQILQIQYNKSALNCQIYTNDLGIRYIGQPDGTLQLDTMIVINNNTVNNIINESDDSSCNNIQPPVLIETIINNSVSGFTAFSMPFQTPLYKKVMVYMTSATGTASYTFPIAFTYLPNVTYGGNGSVTILTLTGITITASTDSTYLILEGY